jgi:hypothetical protein
MYSIFNISLMALAQLIIKSPKDGRLAVVAPDTFSLSGLLQKAASKDAQWYSGDSPQINKLLNYVPIFFSNFSLTSHYE